MKTDYEAIKKMLKSKVPSADLPTKYEYNLDRKKKSLTITVKFKSMSENMQKDEAAFDSWAIALKYYLKEYLDIIIIDWEDVHDNVSLSLQTHCNRFFYRLAKFVQTYDWVKCAKTIPDIPTILMCNFGLKEAAKKEKHLDDSEGKLECEYVERHIKEYDVLDHQFAVGLFKGTVSKTTYYTPGGKSAIDIWGVKGDQFYIFELKIPTNKPLGIISELFFYTNVIDDLLSHRLMYESGKKRDNAIANNYRNFSEFYKYYQNGCIKGITSVFLADNLHTLLTDELIGFINDSARWKYKNIVFESRKVSL